MTPSGLIAKPPQPKHQPNPLCHAMVYFGKKMMSNQSLPLSARVPALVVWLKRQITTGMEADTLPNSWFNHAVYEGDSALGIVEHSIVCAMAHGFQTNIFRYKMYL